jgi:hypothetical protein
MTPRQAAHTLRLFFCQGSHLHTFAFFVTEHTNIHHVFSRYVSVQMLSLGHVSVFVYQNPGESPAYLQSRTHESRFLVERFSTTHHSYFFHFNSETILLKMFLMPKSPPDSPMVLSESLKAACQKNLLPIGSRGLFCVGAFKRHHNSFRLLLSQAIADLPKGAFPFRNEEFAVTPDKAKTLRKF